MCKFTHKCKKYQANIHNFHSTHLLVQLQQQVFSTTLLFHLADQLSQSYTYINTIFLDYYIKIAV